MLKSIIDMLLGKLVAKDVDAEKGEKKPDFIRLEAPVFRKDLILIGVTKNKNKRKLKEYPWVGIYLNQEQLKTHIGIFGSTGRGKTLLLQCIAAQCVWQGWPLLLLDQKYDENLMKICYCCAVLCGRGSDFQVVSPYGIEDPSGLLGGLGSCSYNPLMGIRSSLGLTTALLAAGRKDGASTVAFWEDVKIQIVESLVDAIMSTNKNFLFEDLFAALDQVSALQMLLAESKDERANLALTDWLKNLNNDNGIQAQQNQVREFQGAKMFFRSMSSGSLGKCLGSTTPDVTIRRTYVENKITFFILPALLMNETSKQVAKLVISELNYLAGALQAESNDKKIFMVIADEAYSITTESLILTASMGRSSGIALVIVYQALAQMDMAVSSSFREVLLSNLNSKVSFASAETEQAESLAAMIGHRKIKSTHRYGEISEVAAETFLITPTRLMKLKIFEAVYLIHGKVYQGFVPNLPSGWQLGTTKIPRPKFEPTISNEGGIQIYKRIIDNQ